MAVFIWDAVKVCLATFAKNCQLVEVVVQETENNTVVYRGEDTDSAPVTPAAASAGADGSMSPTLLAVPAAAAEPVTAMSAQELLGVQ